MSTFILVSFDNESSARDAFAAMQEMFQTALMRLSGAVLVDIRTDGSIALETAADDPVTPVTPTEAAVFEKHEQHDDTVDQKFRDQVSKALRPGHWAVLASATEVASGEVRCRLDPLGGDLYSIELSTEDESLLAQQVGIGE